MNQFRNGLIDAVQRANREGIEVRADFNGNGDDELYRLVFRLNFRELDGATIGTNQITEWNLIRNLNGMNVEDILVRLRNIRADLIENNIRNGRDVV